MSLKIAAAKAFAPQTKVTNAEAAQFINDLYEEMKTLGFEDKDETKKRTGKFPANSVELIQHADDRWLLSINGYKEDKGIFALYKHMKSCLTISVCVDKKGRAELEINIYKIHTPSLDKSPFGKLPEPKYFSWNNRDQLEVVICQWIKNDTGPKTSAAVQALVVAPA